MKTKNGDLCGSRTRVVGMKTRCTNRYTKRPTDIIITNLFKITRVCEFGAVGIGGIGRFGEESSFGGVLVAIFEQEFAVLIGGVGGGNQHLAQGDGRDAGFGETREKIGGLLLIVAKSVGIIIRFIIRVGEVGDTAFGLIFGGVIQSENSENDDN